MLFDKEVENVKGKQEKITPPNHIKPLLFETVLQAKNMELCTSLF